MADAVIKTVAGESLDMRLLAPGYFAELSRGEKFSPAAM